MALNLSLPQRLPTQAHQVKSATMCQGRVWTMVAGGGASVIYADTVGDLGFAEELGNYAEYSGAPNTQACALAAAPLRPAMPCNGPALSAAPRLLQDGHMHAQAALSSCIIRAERMACFMHVGCRQQQSVFAPRSLTGSFTGCALLQETYAYAKTLLDCATASADGRPRALLVGGGIANFTDVAATFKGIIQARCMPGPAAAGRHCYMLMWQASQTKERCRPCSAARGLLHAAHMQGSPVCLQHTSASVSKSQCGDCRSAGMCADHGACYHCLRAGWGAGHAGEGGRNQGGQDAHLCAPRGAQLPGRPGAHARDGRRHRRACCAVLWSTAGPSDAPAAAGACERACCGELHMDSGLIQGCLSMTQCGAIQHACCSFGAGIPVEVFGPDTSMTVICAKAIQYVKSHDA